MYLPWLVTGIILYWQRVCLIIDSTFLNFERQYTPGIWNICTSEVHLPRCHPQARAPCRLPDLRRENHLGQTEEAHCGSQWKQQASYGCYRHSCLLPMFRWYSTDRWNRTLQGISLWWRSKQVSNYNIILFFLIFKLSPANNFFCSFKTLFISSYWKGYSYNLL